MTAFGLEVGVSKYTHTTMDAIRAQKRLLKAEKKLHQFIDEVKKEIASKMKSDEALVVMKRILTHYGEQTGEFEAYVYKDQKSLERVEPKKKEKKEGEAAEGAKKEEAPKEDKKEEKSAEAKEEKKEDKKEPSKPSEPAEPSKPAGD